jgi:hypothetical protein
MLGMILLLSDLLSVWECGCGCFSKKNCVEMHQNNIFFIFLKKLISTHQNDLKTLKTY